MLDPIVMSVFVAQPSVVQLTFGPLKALGEKETPCPAYWSDSVVPAASSSKLIVAAAAGDAATIEATAIAANA